MVAVAGACQGASYTYNTGVDINSAFLTTLGSFPFYQQFLSGNTPFTLQAGDTLSGTITFNNNAAMHLQVSANASNRGIGFEFYQPGSFFESHYASSLQFLGVTGTLSPTTSPVQNLYHTVVSGTWESLPASSDFTFTGVSYAITITDISYTGGPFPISFGRLEALADSISIVTATPEPASILFVGTGFVALGWIRRRLC